MQNVDNAPEMLNDDALDSVTGGGQLLDHTVTFLKSDNDKEQRGQILDHTVTFITSGRAR